MLKKIICAIGILVLIAALGVGGFYLHDYIKHAPQRNDYERIGSEDYTGVFLSTFPIDHYTEEDFSLYREIYALKASYCIPDTETLNEYFEKIGETWNEVNYAYLGIRPDIITAEDLIALTESNSDKQFEIIVAYPSMDYWANLKEEEYTVTMQAYKDFVNTLMPLYLENDWMNSHFSIFFYNSSEWLVDNPTHYESDFNVNAGISHMLAMYNDADHGYKLTQDNYEERLESFEEMVEKRRTEPEEYPDLSKWDVVFFGDSVMDFKVTSSIPSAFAGLTGAHVYNCSRGGSSAAATADAPGISDVVDAFLAKDPSVFEEDTMTYQGMTDYYKNAKKNRQKCFVMNFGLNDFFSGYPVYSDDPYDTMSYSGALRTAIDKLRAAYPDAKFILLTPNYSVLFSHGLEAQSAAGGLLTDYVVAAMTLADEEDTLLFDSYNLLGIDNTNFSEYLLDGTHPNEATRYRMAQGLAKLLN